jgi:hypothetical protein
MFKKPMFALGCFLFVLATAGMAKADSIVTYTIGTGNTAISGVTGDPGPYATLQIDLTSSNTATFTFTGTNVSGYSNEFWEVALNLVDTNVTLGSTITSGASLNSSSPSWTQENCTTGGGCAMDGFGKFNFALSDGSGAGDAVDSLVFTLTWTDSPGYTDAGSILAGNNNGDLAAVHTVIFSQTNCSTAPNNVCTTGYAGNSTPIPPVVPEPPTLLLLGPERSR